MALQVESSVQPDAQNQRLAALISSDYDYARPRRKEIRQATVLTIEGERVFVDLGAKRDGLVPHKDLALLNAEYRKSLHVGAQVPVYVLDASDDRDEIIVSLNKGLAQRDWLCAQELLESGESFQGTVQTANRGGVVVPFGRLRGFVPNSHLTSVPRGLRGDRLHRAKSDLLGKTLSLTMIEVNQANQKLVLSERVARRRQREQLLAELTEGDVRTGTVRNLVRFGAFVDLGGVDGLIHITELDWRYVKHPGEVLSVGDSVEVYVLDVDRERERIGLSRKRLLPDPWASVTGGMNQGDVVEGTVTGVVEFGAFVDLGQGVEGLVHITEMPDGEQTKASLAPGSSVHVRVLRIDLGRRRISLSLRIFAQERVRW